MSNRCRVPEQLNTVGDHLRRRRLTLRLLQRQVAEQLGVDKASVYNWETNRTKPDLESMPSIIRFLGYNPLPPAIGWAERLVQGRTALGLSQKEAARQIEVDPSTLARWERGEREPAGAFATRAFLNAADVTGLRVKDAHLSEPSNHDNPTDCANPSEKQIFVDSSIAAL